MLPSGNCVAVEHLLAAKRDVDPFTNVALPRELRRDLLDDATPLTDHDKKVAALLASARHTCDTTSTNGDLASVFEEGGGSPPSA
mmetsp:Transcript_28881/g.93098  ORF Transcript_28881/g.93098 Transcript_28881/m.93098 type:complete len:85 (-) Transcript_28881:73-327(-)